MSTFLRDDAIFAAIAGGDLPAAAQSDQETATSTTTVVTPGRQQFHPSAAKAWGAFNGNPTLSILASFNVASIVRAAVGTYDVTLTTPFSSANYAVVYGFNADDGTSNLVIRLSLTSASVFRLQTLNAARSANPDVTPLCFACFGDQ